MATRRKKKTSGYPHKEVKMLRDAVNVLLALPKEAEASKIGIVSELAWNAATLAALATEWSALFEKEKRKEEEVSICK